MCAAPDATNIPNEPPLAVIVELPESLKRTTNLKAMTKEQKFDERELFIKTIRKHISCGRAVVVKGWAPELQIDFNMDDIQLIRPTMTQEVQYQGKTPFHFFYFLHDYLSSFQMP